MVWFYLTTWTGRAFLRTHFQSHYGLILSTLFTCRFTSITCLSIPLWSDFIAQKKLQKWLDWLHFQSHYGLILSARRYLRNRPNRLAFNPTMVWFYPKFCPEFLILSRHLSIPLWSDFITIRFWFRYIPMCFFQSHYGLILSYPYKCPMCKNNTFQSHYGLILSQTQ